MNIRLRRGKGSEMIVAGELIRNELDVYLPCVDDQNIDLIIRAEIADRVQYYVVQVKSVKGYNRIIGVKDVTDKKDKFLLIIHYRHDKRKDEFFYLTEKQVAQHHVKGSDWGDLILNKDERAKYAEQTLPNLAKHIKKGEL